MADAEDPRDARRQSERRLAKNSTGGETEGCRMMTKERFDILRDDFLEKEAKILYWKQGEYSSGDDALQNFREVAELSGVRLSEVALVWLLKHIQSISLAVRNEKYSWTWQTDGGEGLKQRIVDARNYLLFLAACLEEEVKSREGEKDA